MSFLDVFGIFLSLPSCLSSDDVAAEALDLTVVPLECAVLAMTITLLEALSCDGPDLRASLQEQAGLSPVYQGVRIESPVPAEKRSFPSGLKHLSNDGAWAATVPQELGSQLSCSGNTSDRHRGGSMWWQALASHQVSLDCYHAKRE